MNNIVKANVDFNLHWHHAEIQQKFSVEMLFNLHD